MSDLENSDDEIDTFKIKDVSIIDGQNHPLDKKKS